MYLCSEQNVPLAFCDFSRPYRFRSYYKKVKIIRPNSKRPNSKDRNFKGPNYTKPEKLIRPKTHLTKIMVKNGCG